MKPERNIDAESMMPRPDLAAFPLDDGLVVFSEGSQSLIGLNRAAAFILSGLQNGMAPPALCEALVAEGYAAAGEAEAWVKATLEALGKQGLLVNSVAPQPAALAPLYDRAVQDRATMPPLEPFVPKAEGHYRLLGTHALIRYAHRAQKRMVDSVIGHLATDAAPSPNLVIDIAAQDRGEGQIGSSIYRNGEPERRAGQLSALGPLVKAALWSEAVNAFDFILDLHAGVVGEGGRCILLPAAAGSGKSSLTAALTHSGLGYYSDEVALVGRHDFRVSPVPLAVCVKSTGWDLMSRYFSELPDLPIHRRSDQKRVRYVPPRAVQKEPAQVSHIFFPLYCKDEPTQLAPVSRSDALARLMDQCVALRLRLDRESVKKLVAWIGGIDCYALTFSSLDEAVTLVRNTAFAK